MADSVLTAAETKKLDNVVSKLSGTLKIKVSDEKRKANLARYANKWVRFKLGRRGTGPHAHGFDADQRKVITAALADAFGIKAKPRKTATAPAKGKAVPRKRASSKKSASQLAGEQQARAEGQS
jgi:hypothetical protein